ncbi:hypothetical protein AK812_SmicGene46489, partial [Symbiodinium microadriaticum]
MSVPASWPSTGLNPEGEPQGDSPGEEQERNGSWVYAAGDEVVNVKMMGLEWQKSFVKMVAVAAVAVVVVQIQWAVKLFWQACASRIIGSLVDKR